MAGPPEVLLLDDGELDDVQEILDSLETPYGRIRGGAVSEHTSPPGRLLVTTPRHAAAVDLTGTERVLRIVVVAEDSTTLRARLRKVGFDYLVRRPVHPEALRLLLIRCLYAGDERRNEERVPVGLHVSFRAGLLPRRVVLADLSTGGCRLLSQRSIPIGRRVQVKIPPRAGGTKPVVVHGTVVRILLDENLGPDGPYSAAIAFEDDLAADVRSELEWIVGERARGPATLNAGNDGTDTGAATLAPPETSSGVVAQGVRVDVDVQLSPGNGPAAMPDSPAAAASSDSRRATPSGRRIDPRAAYPGRVAAVGDHAMRVLIARDLSMGGVRIERAAGLELGDRLHLALYASAHESPVRTWATAARDDGDDGLFFRFDALEAAVAEKLDKLVASLPAVESLHQGEAAAMGSVIAEILPD